MSVATTAGGVGLAMSTPLSAFSLRAAGDILSLEEGILVGGLGAPLVTGSGGRWRSGLLIWRKYQDRQFATRNDSHSHLILILKF